MDSREIIREDARNRRQVARGVAHRADRSENRDLPLGDRMRIAHAITLNDEVAHGREARSGFARQAEQKVGDRRSDLRVDIGLAAALRLQSGLRDQQRMIAA